MKKHKLDSLAFRALAYDLLRAGRNLRFQAQGLSMLPTIQDGDLLHVEPVGAQPLRRGDILLVDDGSKFRVHRLIFKDEASDHFITQGDASLEPDFPVRATQIMGRVMARVITKESTMNGTEQRVKLTGMQAQARRRMMQARGVASNFVKSALGIRRAAVLGAFALLAFGLAVAPASAQVVFDANDIGGGGRITTGGNFAITHTTAGTNRILVVGVAMNITNNAAAKVATITYAGLPLTFVSAKNDAGNTRRVEIWFRLQPALGSNTIQVTLNAFGAGTIGATAGGVTFTGADQTDPVRPFASATGSTTAPFHSVLDVPSALKEYVYAVEAIGGDFSQNLPAAGFGGITQQWTGDSNGAPTDPPDVNGGGYTVVGAPSVPIPVVITRQFGVAASTNWAAGAISIHPLNADMGVTVTTNGAIVAGGTTTYTVKLQNNGWSDAANVNLSFPLAVGETFVSAVPSQGSACTGTTTISCNLGTVPSAVTATVTIKVTIATAGNYTTTATVSSTTTDLYTGNNTFTTTVPVQSVVCATPGKDGTPGAAITGIVNTYFPGTASAGSGTTSITVGASAGAATPIAIGDLLLVLQMQDAAINTTNGATYGDGSGSGTGTTSLNGAGAYEYVKAASAVPLAGGTITLVGAGNTGGLIYSYTNANATTTQGQRRFQVVRVPQYVAATLGAALTAAAWNGATGGVLAIDVQNTLTLAGQTVSLDGLGFRGAPGLQLVGVTAGALNTDFVFAAPASSAAGSNGWHGGKGEGIAGSPMWVDVAGAAAASGSTYPSGGAADGSMARGAPGNAGGGGTDAINAAGNSNNSGGSGGANGGAGGAGGNSQAIDLASGGVPSTAFPNSINRVVMGGGGGAGGRNNSAGDASAGGAGGGIVMIRAGFLSGTATITANGAAADVTTANDGGGGGGAGGSIVVLPEAGGEPGLTLQAKGGVGGSANAAVVFAVFTSGVHGPGGGGGGGFIATTNVTGSPATTKTGGANGITETDFFEWGATSGGNGPTPINSARLSQVAGTRSGAECNAPDCVISKTHVGNFVRGSAGNTYTITVTNASPSAAIVAGNTVSVVDTLPVGLTATALTGGAGWTCVLGTLTCTNNLALAPLASYTPITLTVTVAGAPPSNLLTNMAVVSGGGETQTNNDTVTDATTIIGTLLTISKSGAPNPIRPGQTLTYTINVGNSGPNSEATATVTDPLPTTDVSYVSSMATNGWVCVQLAGTVTCSKSPFAVGGTSVITIVTTTLIPDVVVNTATMTDTDTANDTVSATATTITTFPTSVEMRSFSAQPTATGNVLVWKTGGELYNLGFNVYREENGARVKVNPSLIAGSALRMKLSSQTHSGSGYAWIDAHAQPGATYWLEDVSLNGIRTMHGPTYVDAAGSAQSSAASATLAELNRVSTSDATASFTGTNYDHSNPVRRFARIEAVTQQQREKQFELAAHSAVKLSLRGEGWYRVSQPQLVAAGLDPSADPQFLRLYIRAIEQPIRVTGASAGRSGFGPKAAIEFYGTGIDTPYSDAHIGWLVAGNSPGLRVEESQNTGGNHDHLTSFPYAVELRQKLNYFAALLNGPDKDNFFGAIVNSTPVDQVLTTHGVANAGSETAQLEVAIQGATDNTAHSISVNFNGAYLGTLNFNNQQLGKITLAIPAGLLREGDNTATLAALNGDNDVSVVDHLTVHYAHTYTADSDALRFTAPAGGFVQITGFQNKPDRLVDITDSAHPVNLEPKVSGTSGQYALEVNVPWTNSGSHTLLALAWSTLAHAPAAKNNPSTWHAAQAGSDILMLTHPSFTQALQPLVELRRSQSKSVSVVSVDDIYDEFNFGERSPHAVRDFLADATAKWKTAPRYLLLVGDASFDPRNYLGFGNLDFLPTREVETLYLKTPSDEWFSDFKDSGIGEIATGRLPVRTQADIQTAVRKITGYDKNGGAWTNGALLVADNDPTQNFDEDTKAVQKLMPSSMRFTDVFADQDPNAHADIVAGINSGQLLVNYSGHGSVEVWGHLLTDADATALTNGNRLPVFLITDCLNGFFDDVYTTSMAESLLLARDGGAVAVWASSGLNDAPPQAVLDQEAVRLLFSAQNPALGDAVRAAKLKVGNLDIRHTYVLFGDPSMHLHRQGTAPSQK